MQGPALPTLRLSLHLGMKVRLGGTEEGAQDRLISPTRQRSPRPEQRYFERGRVSSSAGRRTLPQPPISSSVPSCLPYVSPSLAPSLFPKLLAQERLCRHFKISYKPKEYIGRKFNGPGGFCPIEQPTLFSFPSACLAEASETSPGHHTEPPPSLSACLDLSLLSV